MQVALVRESGGLGDIVCMGAAAMALTAENPDVTIHAFVPRDFLEIAQHLVGIDSVQSLGAVSELSSVRRRRDQPLDRKKYPYLKVLDGIEWDKIVDLYCPGFLYECSSVQRVTLGRAALFAMAAGVKSLAQAIPMWQSTWSERNIAEELYKTIPRRVDKPIIGVSLRSTCRARAYPQSRWKELLESITPWADVVYLDCVNFPFQIPHVTSILRKPIPVVAALLPLLNGFLTVDTLFIHLCASVGLSTLGVFGPTEGKAVGGRYSETRWINGEGKQCPFACHYRRFIGWNPDKCRPNGCERMLSISPAQINYALKEWIQNGEDISSPHFV